MSGWSSSDHVNSEMNEIHENKNKDMHDDESAQLNYCCYWCGKNEWTWLKISLLIIPGFLNVFTDWLYAGLMDFDNVHIRRATIAFILIPIISYLIIFLCIIINHGINEEKRCTVLRCSFSICTVPFSAIIYVFLSIFKILILKDIIKRVFKMTLLSLFGTTNKQVNFDIWGCKSFPAVLFEIQTIVQFILQTFPQFIIQWTNNARVGWSDLAITSFIFICIAGWFEIVYICVQMYHICHGNKKIVTEDDQA